MILLALKKGFYKNVFGFYFWLSLRKCKLNVSQSQHEWVAQSMERQHVKMLMLSFFVIFQITSIPFPYIKT